MLNFFQQSVIVLLFCLVKTGVSQTLDWSPALKIKDNFHQTPIGKIGSSYYLLSGGSPYHQGVFGSKSGGTSIRLGKNKLKIIKFNEARTTFEEKYLEFRDEMDELIDAYEYDNQIYILYITNDKMLKNKILDKDFNEVGANEFSIKDRKKKRPYYESQDQDYFFLLDRDHKRFVLGTYQNVEVFDNKLAPLASLKLPEQDRVSSAILTGDRLYFIGLEGAILEVTKATAYFYTISSKELKKDLIDDNTVLHWDQTFFLDEASGKLHYFSFSGDKSNLHRKGFRSGDLANNLHHKVYSASLVREETHNFSLEHYKDGKRLGIDYASIREIFQADGINILVTPHTTVASASSFGIAYYGNYLFKIKDGKLVKEASIEKVSAGMDNYYYLYPTAILHGENKHLLLFQQGGSSYVLKKVMVNNDFKVISDEQLNIYKDHDYYLALDEYLKIDKDSYLIFGRYNKNTGSVLIKMK